MPAPALNLPAEPASPTPPEGTNSDELQTLLELGQGGMATAYLARTLGSGGFERLVVLKRLGPELLGNQEALARFLSEARLAAHLRHVNVVGTHQIGWDAAGPYILLDYVEGGSLEDLVAASALRGEQLPPGVVLRIARDALAGLQAVHDATDARGQALGILHRDLSLQNVLVGVHDGVTRLADFGVAKSTVGPTLTEPGCFVGKVLYFPPEYLLQEAVGPTSDIYALGVTLWLALAGEELWPNYGGGRLVRAILDEGVPSLAGRVDLAPELVAFVAKACAPDPDERYQSAREMGAVVEAFDRHQGWVASHAEVAACVERLLGPRLRARRAAIADTQPAIGKSALWGPPRAAPVVAPAGPASGFVARGPARSTMTTRLLGAGILAFVVLGGVMLLLRPERETKSAPSEARAVPVPVLAASVPPQPVVEPLKTAAPPPAETSVASVAPVVAAKPAKRPPPVTKHAVPAPPVPPAHDGIRRSNPYR